MATSAFAQGGAPSNQPTRPSQPGQTAPGGKQGMQQHAAKGGSAMEATKHVAVINAGLRDASTNADMLSQISANASSYDREHGEVFLKNMNDAVAEAETHLGHLQPMATTAAEKQQLRELSQHLTTSKTTLQQMSSQLNDPKATHDSAMKVNQEFKASMAPLKQYAQEANVKIKVG
ncbi:hypothetical protein AKJ08_3701 [Vulgatibacter incomptus]|uniref:Uncharacterized protein n=2 Tax=Vulgatibacter incomptus TaxID=1391653 RepID=A0A0K1PJN1_9BACT|nr:hypothetical protein AKJ08_3701 [Vulgatibacter incomptus]